MSTKRGRIGAWGEHIAAKYLERNGFCISARNVRYTFAELDIVAQKKDMIVFCEVKTRTSYNAASAERATNKTKVSKIKRAAHMFCLQTGIDLNYTMVSFQHISVYVHRHSRRVFIYKYILQ